MANAAGMPVAGGILVALNVWAFGHGKLYGVSRHYRQPVFASEIVLIAAGLVPAWLIMKMTALKKYRPYKFHRHTPKGGGGSVSV
jgi:hypothetical protein